MYRLATEIRGEGFEDANEPEIFIQPRNEGSMADKIRVIFHESQDNEENENISNEEPRVKLATRVSHLRERIRMKSGNRYLVLNNDTRRP